MAGWCWEATVTALSIKTYLVLRMIVRCLPTVQVVLVDELLLTLYSILVHLVQELHA